MNQILFNLYLLGLEKSYLTVGPEHGKFGNTAVGFSEIKEPGQGTYINDLHVHTRKLSGPQMYESAEFQAALAQFKETLTKRLLAQTDV